jgi:hypothetical protein
VTRAAVAVLLATAAAFAQPVRLPVYGVRHAVDAIRIDGKLDEATWALSPRVGEIRLIDNPSRRPVFPTEAAMAWDERALYVSFASHDAEPWGRLKTRDAALWEEEVVEVFLDPDGDGRQYAELEVTPHNVVVDLLIPQAPADGKTGREWNIDGLRTAVSRHAAGWIAEIAIPWKSLAAAGVTATAKPGDQWRGNLFRIKRPGGIRKAERISALSTEALTAAQERKRAVEEELQKLRASDEYSAWALTRPDRGFHDPERFGYWQFMPPAGPPSAPNPQGDK